MDLLADLTPAQREAVTHVDGPLLVLAAAGSGKTRVITRRVAYMLGKGIGGANILALTFTNKAAGEMKERIEALVPKSGVWVGTFHGLCARLLRTYAPLVGIDRGFTIFDQSDRLRAVKDAMERLELEDASVTPERVDSAISRAKNDLVTPEAMAKRAGDHVQAITAKVYARYQERLKAASAVDFDDLLVHLVTILKKHPDVRADLDARFRYVLVDEYQDTNLAQYAIIKALCVDRPNLCVTGDPDQSIYGWRGANIKNILEFEHDFPGCKVVKLEQQLPEHQEHPPGGRLADPPQLQAEGEGPHHRKSPGAAGRADHLRDRVRGGARGRLEDRRAGPRGGIRLPGRRRLLPGHGPDPRPGAGIPLGQDPLSDRRRGLVLRAPGDQGRPLVPEPDGQPQERRGVRPGGQRPPPGDRQDDPGQAQGAGRVPGHPAPGDEPARRRPSPA